MIEEPTPKERILDATLRFQQSKKAKEQFTMLSNSNVHGKFAIQSSESYHATEVYNFGNGQELIISRSLLKQLAENPEQWAAGKKFKRNKKMDMGSLIDAALLETTALKEFEFLPENIKNFTTKAAREARDAAYDADKMPILYSDVEVILATLLQINMSDDAKEMLRGATSCVGMINKIDNVAMKGLIDIVPDCDGPYGDGLCDLKRTKAFLPDKFRRIVFQLKYHWQAAIYLDLWNNWCDIMDKPEMKRNKWYFLIVQEDYPFGVGIAELDPKHIEEGRQQYLDAIKQATWCLRTSKFPNPYSLGEMITIGFPDKKS